MDVLCIINDCLNSEGEHDNICLRCNDDFDAEGIFPTLI